MEVEGLLEGLLQVVVDHHHRLVEAVDHQVDHHHPVEVMVILEAPLHQMEETQEETQEETHQVIAVVAMDHHRLEVEVEALPLMEETHQITEVIHLRPMVVEMEEIIHHHQMEVMVPLPQVEIVLHHPPMEEVEVPQHHLMEITHLHQVETIHLRQMEEEDHQPIQNGGHGIQEETMMMLTMAITEEMEIKMMMAIMEEMEAVMTITMLEMEVMDPPTMHPTTTTTKSNTTMNNMMMIGNSNMTI